jgi:UDP-N-acetylmuramate dehydrogenase
MTIVPHENLALASLTTLNIGGPARYLFKVETEHEIEEALAFAAKFGLPVFILGGGSNLLIADEGFDGVVIQMAIRGVAATEIDDGVVNVTANSGEDWDKFVEYCVLHNLAGVECLSGIPGLVGGAPVQNVGAYGQEVSETIQSVRCYDRIERRIVDLSNEDCRFTYRTSIFNSTQRGRYIVLAVSYALKRCGAPKIVYKDLIDHFGGRTASLVEVRSAVLSIRRAKSMVIDPNDPNSKSAGSFFKNPIVDREKLSEIRSGFPNVPHFDFGEKVKIPAAWLIENAGFQRGFTMGNAGISSKHTLALINRGGATAEEILCLKDAIQTAVVSRFGIALHPEPVFLGFVPQETADAV